MNDPKTPKAWANFLARLWGEEFPIDVRTIALEYSQQRFKGDPITKITEADVDAFEGALISRPKKGCWYILHNSSMGNEGRINFTIAHELGHYLLHRTYASEFQCSTRDVLDNGGQESVKREEEANTFASYLLMPLDDFRGQIGTDKISIDLLYSCARRYNVSLTAAVLKWLEYTSERAVLVIGRDGFVLWSRASRSAFRSGVFFRKGTPLPEASLAASRLSLGDFSNTRDGLDVPPGVWVKDEPVKEMVILSDRYDFTISLLVLPPSAPSIEHQEEETSDLADELMISTRR